MHKYSFVADTNHHLQVLQKLILAFASVCCAGG